ncbi:uncharacterized protein [Vulpes vulpes]|uniref:Basic proline-rich protein-like n=1 Tax=Vulpes vulpes TaxID=9627 RepID=A0ABM4ZDI3_VULVU
MEAPGGDAAPAGFCKGKSAAGAPLSAAAALGQRSGLRRPPRPAKPPPAPRFSAQGRRAPGPRPGTPAGPARGTRPRPCSEARPGGRSPASGRGGAGARGPGQERRAEARGVGTPREAALAPAPPPRRPGLRGGCRPPPRPARGSHRGPGLGRGAGGRSPGDASGAWRARARAPAAASGPRAAAAATALSRRRPRRPPPRARPLAPPRPEPPPGPRRRRRPPLRFVFPSLAVPCLCLPRRPDPALRAPAPPPPPAPAPRPPRRPAPDPGGVGSRRGARASGRGEGRSTGPGPGTNGAPSDAPPAASVSPGWPRARPAVRAPCGVTAPRGRPVRDPTPPPAAESSRRQRPPPRPAGPAAGTRSRHARLRGAAPRGGRLGPPAPRGPVCRGSGGPAAPVPSAATPQTRAPGGCKARGASAFLWCRGCVASVTPRLTPPAPSPERNRGQPLRRVPAFRPANRGAPARTSLTTRERGPKTQRLLQVPKLGRRAWRRLRTPCPLAQRLPGLQHTAGRSGAQEAACIAVTRFSKTAAVMQESVALTHWRSTRSKLRLLQALWSHLPCPRWVCGGDLPAATTGTAAWARRMNGPDRKVKKAVQKERKQADVGVEKRELEV